MEKFTPEIVLLYCQNCVGNSLDFAEDCAKAGGFAIRPAMMPCSSKVEVSYLFKLLDRGADAVQIVACPKTNCKLLLGSTKIEKRVEYARGLIESIGMGAERIGLCFEKELSSKQLVDIASGRAELVRPLGANPMKKGVTL
jgi:coenzyme F420-reducing hydrogenase delta subunit